MTHTVIFNICKNAENINETMCDRPFLVAFVLTYTPNFAYDFVLFFLQTRLSFVNLHSNQIFTSFASRQKNAEFKCRLPKSVIERSMVFQLNKYSQ